VVQGLMVHCTPVRQIMLLATHLKKVFECDIVTFAQYIAGYKCKAPCELDSTLTVTIYCDCHIKMGPLQFIKQCEWQYKDNKKCPNTESNLDWECDPRKQSCPHGQYMESQSIEKNNAE